MTQYLLSIQQPDGPPPQDVDLQKVMENVSTLLQEIKSAGAWVFNGGLLPPNTATVVRPDGNDVLTTDGPYAEGKEHLGGLVVVEAADFESALEWGRKAARAIALPIEVRAFADEKDE